METLLKAIEKIAPFLGAYPSWMQYSVAAWLLLTAAMLIGLVLLHPSARAPQQAQAPTVDSLNAQLTKVVQEALTVPRALQDRFADVVQSPDAGITKILKDGARYEGAIRGGGAYWSFLRRTHEYGNGSDISLRDGDLKTGFAGADYGHILRLGKVSIRQIIDSAAPLPPSWLDPNRHEAWTYLWTYTPPREIAEIRRHQEAARGLVKGAATLSESAPLIVDDAYLLRSINFRESDILVAFQVVDRGVDGSAVLVWRVLKVFDVPIIKDKE